LNCGDSILRDKASDRDFFQIYYGSEFLNHHLLRHFTQRKRPIQFTRSRAYHKDDNSHIEQKNWTHVRQWLGYERFDNPAVVPLLNALYSTEWRLFHNFFCPSVERTPHARPVIAQVGPHAKWTAEKGEVPTEFL
jgi:hypothetical protein